MTNIGKIDMYQTKPNKIKYEACGVPQGPSLHVSIPVGGRG